MSALRQKDAVTSLDQSTLRVVRPSCLGLRMRTQDIIRLVRLLEETRATMRPEAEKPVHYDGR